MHTNYSNFLSYVIQIRIMSDIKDDIQDIGDEMKAATKAASSKVKDPDSNLETEYQK